MAVSIRKPDGEDLTGIHGILERCLAEMKRPGIDQWDEIYPHADGLTRDIREETLFIPVVDGEVAGVAVLNRHEDPEYLDLAWRHGPEGVEKEIRRKEDGTKV